MWEFVAMIFGFINSLIAVKIWGGSIEPIGIIGIAAFSMFESIIVVGVVSGLLSKPKK